MFIGHSERSEESFDSLHQMVSSLERFLPSVEMTTVKPFPFLFIPRRSQQSIVKLLVIPGFDHLFELFFPACTGSLGS
jgi:hypothetical protein